MLRFVMYRTRTDLNRSFLEMIRATDANGGGLDYLASITTIINTIEQTASTVVMHSPVIRGITVILVSEQSTESSKGSEVVASRFRTF